MPDRRAQTAGAVITRFAPSPTGPFQVGGVRSALFNYLYARQHKGKYILRCEDTDPVRSKKEYEDYFLEVFAWLGLEHDEYCRQSERGLLYGTYLNDLLSAGKAYISKEEPKKEGERAEVVRFKNPNKVVSFHDEILGDISVDTTDLGDFVIARDMQSPLYHFTVVVDDFEMGITHVIRGKEHVANTPRQILIQEAIGATRPIYAHLPLILSQDRKKLSKRDPNVTPALTYRDNGYLPEALLNFMALTGWNPGGEQEVFTKEELIKLFSLERVQRSDGIFNSEKLEWLNKEHIRRLSKEKLTAHIETHLPSGTKDLPGYSREMLSRIVPVIAERITHFGEVTLMANDGELDFYFKAPVYPKEKLFWKEDRDAVKLLNRLNVVADLIGRIHDAEFTQEQIKSAVWDYAETEGRGQVLWPMRYALSGKDRSPDPFQLAAILEKKETLERLKNAAAIIGKG
ncbi:MAG: glutamate--tRNA ligase [Candidatus Lloydbacteria bacterium RIFCSPLOWO2_01_FULL_50_20]|uniref:Glutamate--tRNA ligase n=1 Tax=Candidatus Lloydbacteria bacterium RIFCSPLOWO2_01_FULL_50_20 TaxID=1798665 RepID=A0A1G2DJQ2_9BACT|nr:MAG: glutamate--tRNA ligase [Candidatus Lloydbacteria bacterium RIFCSPHIGHO2_02_FULL_50_11]OGZ13733.1 MAG: glutamate--tRNA ligase [Candidatus Lloydbacteria bacterium RIFCSPLOWO2_01_FULL_50_20]